MSTYAAPLENTRNVTIVAHVDHGKTSFADSLLSSNNIISNRMAGKLRYLDSREDEQERGITMESSAVSLRFDMMRAGPDGPVASKHICNVIDTPGHVDFASEVSMASRLCDGALVLVDVWEGVCTQTIAVLRQAWIDRLRPLLVINKMDRLITELQLSPIEAYHHISRLIEQVNAVMGSFYASERMEDDLRWREAREKRLKERAEAESAGDAPEGDGDDEHEFEEREDEDIYFSPERGNVLFASALDGWAFRLGKFARLYADKLGVKEGNLRRALWGDWFLDPKTKRVVGRKGLNGRPLKPLFVQFVLENIWKVYNVVLEEHQYNPEATSKIVKALNVRVAPRELKSKDSRNLLTSIMQQWLPLSTATFQAVVDVIPAPNAAQAIRIPFMLHPQEARASSTPLQPVGGLEKALFACDQRPEAPLVAYVSKMFAVRRGDLPQFKPREMTAEEMRARGREERERRAALAAKQGEVSDPNDLAKPLESLNLDVAVEEPKPAADADAEVLLGFSRVFSSVLRRGATVTVTLPKYDAELGPNHSRNAKHMRQATVSDLYMMMGRDLVAVDCVPAGHVCAIAGLDNIVPRNGTLCAANANGDAPGADGLVNLAGVNMQAAPIVRVALEPLNPSDMPKLIEGLQILNQADPCAEYIVQETGEHVILTAGELHLERCLKDLRERFAKCEIQASEAIVPFRETAIKAQDMAAPKTAGEPRGVVLGSLYDGMVTFKLRAVPLPPPVIEFLLAHQNTIGTMLVHRAKDAEEEEEEDPDQREAEAGVRTLTPEQFWTDLEARFDEAGGEWAGAADRVWSFGPKKVGANVLLDPIGKGGLRLRGREAVFAAARAAGETAEEALALADAAEDAERTAEEKAEVADAQESEAEIARRLRDFDTSIEAGFQLATFQGPLCAEPVVGMAWILEQLTYTPTESGRGAAVVGALISGVRDAARAGMLDWSPRIKLAMYTCDIQASTEVLGKVYGVVARRRGRIVAEEMKEGTDFFTVRAMLPVVESFGFADEIRKRTSGAASPQLVFAGYEVLDLDPFWVPTTVEELEDLGEKADRANVAKGYVDAVRKRKGMFVEKKMVEFAEKQRTLKR
ncbi:hypothetical protein CcaverHIS002_0407330 [Cutaneotrichosporon cavernicola]|uniref:Ribosome assembly protein 1 n=1 Tax=Cutaneotrichosporon cavernicola TaxID=279322 RepID=A0AA48L4R9_9TREE|nr:uncharacterized protein CcaverHIS019_0407330 [Cutaneotrichosporon cavernicola]BEI84129.1 hypothetical protein CcaverHIS002_0407330 [Cutaneotrichosporon cavernicola]BEI91913.1 hypothetical protein CcaverHIS019_0407330 [Cutaneotrichosporon cavernicola]BEI99684.1 hypothetical protein CcaverHIS631_0407270 [Cutaneotrichosporon cavernicola]BEJ07459.1 hypothetical protein CcaverHIS641_0407280 [Cutaneotrichosporon cavernicola]